MGWPKDAFVYLRQIATPKSRPQVGGNLLYTKSDNNLYLLDANGTEHAVGGSGSALTVQDENANVSTSVTQIDFQGAGVTATAGTGEVVVTIPGGGATARTAVFKIAGTLVAGTGATRLYNDTGATWTLTSIRASVEAAPSGGSVVIDVNKNGTTVFTTQANRPTITTTNLTSGTVTAIDVTSVAAGDYLTVDVDSTTTPAANLTVTVVFS